MDYKRGQIFFSNYHRYEVVEVHPMSVRYIRRCIIGKCADIKCAVAGFTEQQKKNSAAVFGKWIREYNWKLDVQATFKNMVSIEKIVKKERKK